VPKFTFLARGPFVRPTTSTLAYPIQIYTPLPIYETPCTLFAETEPQLLGFRFFLPKFTPLARDHPCAPTSSTPAYPTKIDTPLPIYEISQTSFAETEPQRVRRHSHRLLLPPPPPPPPCPHPARGHPRRKSQQRGGRSRGRRRERETRRGRSPVSPPSPPLHSPPSANRPPPRAPKPQNVADGDIDGKDVPRTRPGTPPPRFRVPHPQTRVGRRAHRGARRAPCDTMTTASSSCFWQTAGPPLAPFRACAPPRPPSRSARAQSTAHARTRSPPCVRHPNGFPNATLGCPNPDPHPNPRPVPTPPHSRSMIPVDRHVTREQLRCGSIVILSWNHLLTMDHLLTN
jgi:hypothetical protein